MSAPTTTEWLRTAADRLAVGSGRLATRYVGRALATSTAWVGRWPGWLKAGAVLVALARGPQVLARLGDWAHARAASGAWAPGLFTTAGLWAVAAYRAGRADRQPAGESTTPVREGGEEPAASESGPDDDAGEQPSAEPLLPGLPDLRTALLRVGTPHAHLAVLAAAIGTTPDRVREALDRWEIPVEAVRMQGRGTSTGVKGGPAAHPALAPRPDDVADVAAGQPGNNSNNNAPDIPAEEGLRVEAIGLSGAIIRDPADTVRHHTVASK
ncbi:hypothetical protein [Streptomyces sp. NPDC004042]|uniref:hypothetical protein n=1 Tax=Streptomyces sp. NPDC004042 TaxID=3154451 RepID=UPI0033AE587F